MYEVLYGHNAPYKSLYITIFSVHEKRNIEQSDRSEKNWRWYFLATPGHAIPRLSWTSYVICIAAPLGSSRKLWKNMAVSGFSFFLPALCLLWWTRIFKISFFRGMIDPRTFCHLSICMHGLWYVILLWLGPFFFIHWFFMGQSMRTLVSLWEDMVFFMLVRNLGYGFPVEFKIQGKLNSSITKTSTSVVRNTWLGIIKDKGIKTKRKKQKKN